MTDNIDLKSAITRLQSGEQEADAQTRFWYHDPIPQQAQVSIDSRTYARIKRICFHMNKYHIPVYRPWLEQLMRWHRAKGGKIKTSVIALKYQLLYEAMKHGMSWDRALDDHAEALALEAVQEHKEKTRR